jgi:polar amino acid transport system ATP-binding protein
MSEHAGTSEHSGETASQESLPLVRIRGLRKNFGSHRVLDGIDLDVHEGEVTVLLGPSGSGKSTLLRCVNHLEKPDAGFVEVAGELIGYRDDHGRLRGRALGWCFSSSTCSAT